MLYIGHLINCGFTYLLMTLICYMLNSLERVVNAELSKVQEWLVNSNSNRLTLNAKKLNFVIFHPY